jgi:hypothetical protein
LGHDVTVFAARWHRLLRDGVDTDALPVEEIVEGYRFVRVDVPKYAHAHDKRRILSWLVFAAKLPTPPPTAGGGTGRGAQFLAASPRLPWGRTFGKGLWFAAGGRGARSWLGYPQVTRLAYPEHVGGQGLGGGVERGVLPVRAARDHEHRSGQTVHRLRLNRHPQAGRRARLDGR